MIGVVLVDDHPIVRAGLIALLAAEPDIRVLAETGEGAQAVALVRQHSPDVLVLDVNLPDINGLDVARQLIEEGAGCAILILTALDDARLVFELLEAGVTGYVLKDEALETLPHAVRAAARGEAWLSPSVASKVVRRVTHREDETRAREEALLGDLTPREFEILNLIAQGLDNAAIAERLVVTRRTVQNHVSNIYGKLGVDSRAQAMLLALRHGLGGDSIHDST